MKSKLTHFSKKATSNFSITHISLSTKFKFLNVLYKKNKTNNTNTLSWTLQDHQLLMNPLHKQTMITLIKETRKLENYKVKIGTKSPEYNNYDTSSHYEQNQGDLHYVVKLNNAWILI